MSGKVGGDRQRAFSGFVSRCWRLQVAAGHGLAYAYGLQGVQDQASQAFLVSTYSLPSGDAMEQWVSCGLSACPVIW